MKTDSARASAAAPLRGVSTAGPSRTSATTACAVPPEHWHRAQVPVFAGTTASKRCVCNV
jgi:hypothetical protein